mgnify:CR=1 FL=1
MLRLPRIERGRDVLVLFLVFLALYQLSGAGMIKAKAWLAPVLIERAWELRQRDPANQPRPWPWADTWPVARLRAPAQKVDLLVLSGDSGNALAFGPGHTRASAPLGSGGRAVIGGHRDTHFAFLQALQAGDPLQLHLPGGVVRSYRVAAASVVDTRRQVLQQDETGESLLLVTCYPFDALNSGGPLRYAVTALPAVVLPDEIDDSVGSRRYDL